MNITKRRLAVATLACAALLTAGACGGTPAKDSDNDGGTPVADGKLVIADSADNEGSIDTADVASDIGWRLQAMVYETLVNVDAEGKVQAGGPTESYEQTSDTEYVFHLKPGVKFSNGRELTADDVVGSIERLLDPKTQAFWAGQLGPVASVKATDDETVVITLKSAYTPFLAAIANLPAAILPMKELNDGSFDPDKKMLGSGPFEVKDHVQGESWTFAKNPNYHDAESVNLSEITVNIIADDATRVAALRDGTADLASFSSPDAPTLLESVPNTDVTVQGSSDMYWMQLNAANPDSPFTDKLVRQAMAYAIDRDELINTALAGQGEQTGVAPVTLPGGCNPADLPTYTRDVDKAKSLLEEAGKSGLEIKLMAPPYLPTFTALVQVLQQNLEEAGFKVSIEKPEYGAYFDSTYVQQPATFEAMVDYYAGYADPAMVMQFLSPDQNPITAGYFTENPELTDALNLSTRLPTGDQRDEAIQNACTLAAEDAQAVPLSTKLVTLAARTDRVSAEIPKADYYDVYFRNVETYNVLQ